MEAPADLKLWRKELRHRLITRRTTGTPIGRAAWNRSINDPLEAAFPALVGLVVGFC